MEHEINESPFGGIANTLKKYGGKDNIKDDPKKVAPKRSAFHGDIAMTGHKEKINKDGSRSYSKVLPDHDDDAEVQGRDADPYDHGQQDRGQDDNGGQRLHEGADDEQQHVDKQQNDDLALGEAQDGPGDGAGHHIPDADFLLRAGRRLEGGAGGGIHADVRREGGRQARIGHQTELGLVGEADAARPRPFRLVQ